MVIHFENEEKPNQRPWDYWASPRSLVPLISRLAFLSLLKIAHSPEKRTKYFIWSGNIIRIKRWTNLTYCFSNTISSLFLNIGATLYKILLRQPLVGNHCDKVHVWEGNVGTVGSFSTCCANKLCSNPATTSNWLMMVPTWWYPRDGSHM